MPCTSTILLRVSILKKIKQTYVWLEIASQTLLGAERKMIYKYVFFTYWGGPTSDMEIREFQFCIIIEHAAHLSLEIRNFTDAWSEYFPDTERLTQ